MLDEGVSVAALDRNAEARRVLLASDEAGLVTAITTTPMEA
jgi:hypothetical protein